MIGLSNQSGNGLPLLTEADVTMMLDDNCQCQFLL